MTRISVIIPNWNGEAVLPICLSSLREQSIPADQVIVVDNGSTDRSLQVAESEYPGVTLLKLGRNYGFGYAVNRGIESSVADLILLLNNDAQAERTWIEVIRDFFLANPQALFCACKMLNFYDREIIDGAGDCLTRGGIAYKIGSAARDGAAYSVHRQVFGASGGASAFRAEFFRKVGLFDERFFMYLEDVDLSLRAQLNGISCYFLPAAIVYHMEAQTDPDRAGRNPNPHTPSRTLWITRNRVLLLAKDYPASLLLRYLPRIIFGFVKSFGFHLIKTGYAGSFLKGFYLGLRAIGSVLRDRKAIQSSAKISTRRLHQLLEQC